MLGNIFLGIQGAISLENFIIINLGLLFGIIIGALPGLNVTMGVALLLPLTFGMDPIPGILLLLGIYCGGIYGGSITAILIKTPGTPAAAATVADGYTLAQKGHSGKALDMAVVASTCGGLISAIILLFCAEPVAQFALKFGPEERFSLCVFGLSIIAAISGKDILKGLTMGLVGMLVAMIGLDPILGMPRFTFGNYKLDGGIELVTSLIGLFAISEILVKVTSPSEEAGEIQKITKDRVSVKEFLYCLKTIIKSSIIGTVIGAIPGTGGAIAAFMSYNEAKRSSKHPEEFGNGSIEGIAASESGNNGVTGATLIPLLTLGVPGDSVTAVMLGTLMMQGLTPGPTLFTDHASIVYTIIIGLFFVNIFMLVQGKLLARIFVHVSRIPKKLLIACLILLCLTGTYASNNSITDVYVAIIFGIVGYIAMKYRYPVTPLLIAIILGPMAETNFRQALVLSRGTYLTFLTSPISAVFLLLAVVSVVLSLLKAKKQS